MRTPRSSIRGAGLFCLFVASAALNVFSPSGARAQDVASDATTDPLDRALAEYEAGRLEEARRWFLLAHEHHPTARTLRGLGVVSYSLGAYEDAEAYLSAALRHPERPLTDELRALVTRLLEDCHTHLGRIVVASDVDGLVLFVDSIGVALDDQAGVYVRPGEHVVRMTAPGHEPREVSVDLAAGSAMELAIGPSLASEPSRASNPMLPEEMDVEPPARPTRANRSHAYRRAARAMSILSAGLLAAGATELLVARTRYTSLGDDCASGCSRAEIDDRYARGHIRGLALGGVTALSVGVVSTGIVGALFRLSVSRGDRSRDSVAFDSRSIVWTRRF